jgi:hypothetical protein
MEELSRDIMSSLKPSFITRVNEGVVPMSEMLVALSDVPWEWRKIWDEVVTEEELYRLQKMPEHLDDIDVFIDGAKVKNGRSYTNYSAKLVAFTYLKASDAVTRFANERTQALLFLACLGPEIPNQKTLKTWSQLDLTKVVRARLQGVPIKMVETAVVHGLDGDIVASLSKGV